MGEVHESFRLLGAEQQKATGWKQRREGCDKGWINSLRARRLTRRRLSGSPLLPQMRSVQGFGGLRSSRWRQLSRNSMSLSI